jgi:hypothetical protein
VVTMRRGASKLGCLLSVLLVVGASYVGLFFGRVYWTNAEYKDEMKQELQFHSGESDEQIRNHMRVAADSMGLPEEAGDVTVERDPQAHTIDMDAVYDVTVKLPGYQRVVHLTPHASDTY